MVVTDFPAIELTGVTHERMGFPSSSTVQAPHCAMPHPYFVPVNPAASRIAQRSGMSGGKSSFTVRLFSLREIDMALPHNSTLARKAECRKGFVVKRDFCGASRHGRTDDQGSR